MRYVVIVAFVFILASLGFALIFMMKDKGKSNRMVNALAMRVAFSIALFLFVLFCYRMGWIHYTGIG